MSFKRFLLSKVFYKNLGLAIAILAGSLIILLIWMNFYTRHGQARPVPDFTGLDMEETARLARKSKLRYQVIDSIYTTLVPRGCVAEQNPRPGFKVKKWRNVILIINAYNPEMIVMPNLIDLPKRQALAVIESTGLEMGQLRYKPDITIDVVLEQLLNGENIEPGDTLQKGSVIDLILGKGLSNQRTPVPDLTGMKLDDARDKILISSLNLGTFLYDNTIEDAEDSVDAFVYKQNPAYENEVSLKLGDDIYLWLTTDSSKLPVDSTLISLTDTIPAAGIVREPPNQQ